MGRSSNHKPRVATCALLLGLVLFQVQSFAASALVCLHQPPAATGHAVTFADACPYHRLAQSGATAVDIAAPDATPNTSPGASPALVFTEIAALSPAEPLDASPSWSDCQKCRLAISAAGWHLFAPPVLPLPVAGNAVLSPTVAAAFFRYVPELLAEPPITQPA